MKIRIKNNSVRYRLTRSDVEVFTTAGYLADKVDFGEQSFTYALQLTDDEQLSASFENNTITLFMPQSMISEWINTDRTGFENNPASAGLHLLVEKDFTCLDNVTEDQSDNYPNPLANKTV
jgi:hypothetical protein